MRKANPVRKEAQKIELTKIYANTIKITYNRLLEGIRTSIEPFASILLIN